MSKQRVVVYTPQSPLANPGRMVMDMIGDLLRARSLAWRLAIRDLSSQYRQALLGFLWVLLVPAGHAVAWIFLSANRVVEITGTDLPYPLYVITGTLLWAIFTESLQAPLQGASTAQNMLTRVNFPREAIVLSGVYQTSFNALIKTILLLLALFSFGIAPDWHLILLPLGIASLILLGTTLGVLLTPIGLLYTDVGKGIPLLMQFLMYLTPVVFSMPQSGLAAAIFSFNPLTPVIMTVRNWLTGSASEMIGQFCLVNGTSLILLLVVWVIYRLAMPILIERMSA